MAVYKVAQDVEADDKLLGPFSFRQFIYLIVVAISGALAWAFWTVFPPLALIPVPLIIFFGALALPLRKDQPMEVYLAAVLSFHLKPKRRLWVPDGVQSLVEITAPKKVEENRTKGISENEAEKRLSYLAAIADTKGWSIRNAPMPQNPSMVGDIYNEAQQTRDVFDETGGVSQSFDTMISKSDADRRQHMIDQMHNPQPAQQTSSSQISDPYASLNSATLNNSTGSQQKVTYNPYPTSMRQSVVSPIGDKAAQNDASQQPMEQTAKTTSDTSVSPDIINLANNPDLSIETIAHEAQRISKRKKHDDDEVVISLR